MRRWQDTRVRGTGADLTGLAGHGQEPARERGFSPEFRGDQGRVLPRLEAMPPLPQLRALSKETGRLSGLCPGLCQGSYWCPCLKLRTESPAQRPADG